MKLSAHWEKHVTGLKATGQYAADCILTSMAVLCMPHKTYAEWSKYTADYEDVPPVSVFQKFLKEQVKSLRKSDSDPSSHDDNPFATSSFPKKKKPFRAAFNLVEKSSVIFVIVILCIIVLFLRMQVLRSGLKWPSVSGNVPIAFLLNIAPRTVPPARDVVDVTASITLCSIRTRAQYSKANQLPFILFHSTSLPHCRMNLNLSSLPLSKWL